jgi:hypothetical protein
MFNSHYPVEARPRFLAILTSEVIFVDEVKSAAFFARRLPFATDGTLKVVNTMIFVFDALTIAIDYVK